MSVLDVLTYPRATLRKKSGPVQKISEDVKSLIRDMKETMYASGGIGLAAPQVGVSQRVIVVDVTPYEPEQEPFALINPEIVSSDGDVESEEGCLSVPGLVETIKRKERVTVRGLDEEGKEVEIEASGMLAICLQHEIDHLDGLTVVERLSPVKRGMIKKKLVKAARNQT
ncbi:MAG: peptide deformylase [Proteobacteria bacterium]|nr:peptide deformylase [Pseudomonadota bacterium]NIS68106.1 peptide deformylase [Pseudomonadota bacterium]